MKCAEDIMLAFDVISVLNVLEKEGRVCGVNAHKCLM